MAAGGSAMKRVDYNPSTVAVFQIDHSVRGDTDVIIGMGSKGTPIAAKEFEPPNWSCDGDDAYPSNLIVVDISEFNYDAANVELFYLDVNDKGTSATGMIQSFSVEQYSDYLNGTLVDSNTSSDPPVATQQDSHIYATTWLGSVTGIDLSGLSLNVHPTNLYASEGMTQVDFQIVNFGDTDAGSFDVKFVLSDDNVIDPATDMVLQLDPSDPSFDAGEPEAYHVSSGLLAGTIIVSLIYLFTFQLNGGSEYLLGAHEFSHQELEEMLNKVNMRLAG